MSSTDQNTSSRKAEHGYIDLSGAAVEDQELAAGITYKDKATGAVFAYLVPDAVPGSVQTMLAIFGAKTLATNTASASRNAGVTDEVGAIRVRFEDDLKDGQWNSPADRAGGIRIDIDAAIMAIIEVLEADGLPTGRVQARANATESTGEFAGKEVGVPYLRSALKNDKIQAAYKKLLGKEGPKTSDLV